MNVHQHAFGIDVRDFEVESFVESQPQRIDDGKEADHRWLIDESQEYLDFFDGQDSGQFDLLLNLEHFESGPLAGTRLVEEELEPTVGDVEGALAPLSIVFDVEER
jgi:hypothetical protein